MSAQPATAVHGTPPWAKYDLFDVHSHVGQTALSHAINFAGVGDIDPALELRLRLEAMDDAAIAQAVVMPGHSYDRTDGIAATRRENDRIAAYRDANPDRFPVGVGLVEPLDISGGPGELRRIHDELGFKGVTFHTEFQGVVMDAAPMMSLLEQMTEMGMVALLHAPNDSISEQHWRLAKVARAFPELKIIAMEPFFTMEGLLAGDLTADVAPNVLFETASVADTDVFRSFVYRWGAGRIAYGSHTYSTADRSARRGKTARAAQLRAEIADYEISDDDKRALFGGNARRLFGLER
jgi:predicted TIM-barrel fold metal-dependent hydrolase